MMLKPVSPDSIPRALELAERYRLLNEPEQATSICYDVLNADPHNSEAIRMLFLATTEQFSRRHGTKFEDAEKVAGQMLSSYDRAYFGGMACERWARAKLQEGAQASWVGDWLRRAMSRYEEAEALRAPGNDDAILRWNACARLLQRFPGLDEDRDEPILGD